MFAYCGNNPGKYADCYGHYAILAILPELEQATERLINWWESGGREATFEAEATIGAVLLWLLDSESTNDAARIIGEKYYFRKSSPHSKSTSSALVKSIAGSTPASPPDPNGNGEKHSYQKIGKNSFANKIAQKFGYENAEEFKDSIVGQGNGGRFNIGYDKVSKEVVLIRIQGNDVIPTGYFLEFPIY